MQVRNNLVHSKLDAAAQVVRVESSSDNGESLLGNLTCNHRGAE